MDLKDFCMVINTMCSLVGALIAIYKAIDKIVKKNLLKQYIK